MIQTVELAVTDRGSLLVKVVRADGSFRTDDITGNPTIKTVRRASRNLNIPEDAIWSILQYPPVDSLNPTIKPYADLIKPAVAPAPFRVRDLGSNATVEYATFDDALVNATSADAVIEWSDIEACCAVDLDYHASDVPDAAILETRVRAVQPQPRYWWFTKSGSLRLIYFAHDKLTARDYAAVAALQLSANDHRCQVELLTRTRRPATGQWFDCAPTYTCDYLNRLVGRVDSGDGDWSQWLEDNSFVVGQRYPHTACPVNSYEAATGNPGNALIVHETYIKCYICERDGTRFGSSDAGYFPLVVLAGDPVPARLKVCVKRFVHWGHAQFVMQQDCPGIPENIAPAVYRAMLKLVHGDDARIPGVFAAGEPNGLVRFNGYWADRNGTAYKLNSQSPMLAALPYTLDAQMVPDRAKMELLAQTVDLSANGYPALAPIWGCRVTFRQSFPQHRVFTVLQTRDLRPPEMTWRRAKYLEPAARPMDVEAAWQVLEQIYPRVNRNAVRLMIAAKGCSEMKSGLPPMIFFTGPTGAGKTGASMVAAAICGDAVRKLPFSANGERLFAAIRSVKDGGSFASFDEFLKGASRHRCGPESAMELVLDLNEDAVTHMLYVGPVALGDLPVLVWTDTVIPPSIRTHAQIGRRMHHVYLPNSLDWVPALHATDIREPHLLRVRGTREMIAAANVVLSDVIDEFFPAGTTTDFNAVADALGFKKLNDCELAREGIEHIRTLYDMVTKHEGGVMGLPDSMRVLCPGDGWSHINLDMSGEAAALYNAICDPRDPTQCRLMDELDLRAVLGTAGNVQCERRIQGRLLAIRFRGV